MPFFRRKRESSSTSGKKQKEVSTASGSGTNNGSISNIANGGDNTDGNSIHNNHSNDSANNSTPNSPNSSRNTVTEVDTSALVNGGGAKSVDGSMTIFRVPIPPSIQPGQEFQVYAGQRIVRVRCPPNGRPGQFLQITVPIEPANKTPSLMEDSPNVQPAQDGTGAYNVQIPEGVRSGQQFPVTIQGQMLMVTCPANATPGMIVRIVPPPPQTLPLTPSTSATSIPQTDLSEAPSMGSLNSTLPQHQQQSIQQHRQHHKAKEDEETQLFEVIVPQGVRPGQSFALLAAGVRVLVTCPINAGPGQRIRFKLPKALTAKRTGKRCEAAEIKLSYDKDGWTRTIRVSDMKFQWVRMDDNGDIDTNTRFQAEKSAYVRKLAFLPGTDDRIRGGEIWLVPANEAVMDSKVKGNDGSVIVTYSEIADAQGKNFEDKALWFQEKCKMIRVDWSEGHMRINIRRNCLLEDSVDAVMSLSRKDLRKVWKFEFIGEPGIDAGGLAREWFQLVTAEIFDADMGLWQSSEANQMCMQINPASRFVGEDFLVYYRFMGRVMGKALLDGQLVNGHMVQYIYKHILGWPITFKDILSIDEEYFNNLRQIQQLADMGENLEDTLCMYFSTTQEVIGVKEEIDLVEGGKDIPVTNDNYPEYLEACLKYRMMHRVKDQLTELLLGFFDVIPEPLLTVFDFQELELLMCGLPVIDMEDWREHTEYSGEYEYCFGDCPPCHWFWEVVDEFDHEMKARLLQFVTGTSGVPARGFGVLHGNDGNIRKFTIHGIRLEASLYPRAHTCFNRIDLPMYETKEELREKLKLAVTMVATGFDIE